MIGIKIKLLLGFLLSILTLSYAFYYAYRSFSLLEESVNALAVPDESSLIFNKILRSLAESDNSMRTYSMTASEAALGDYLYNMTLIEKELDTIDLLFENASGNKEILELKSMLQNKADLMYALVELKNLPEFKTIASRSMQNIASAVIDSSLIDNLEVADDTPALKSSSLSNPSVNGENEKNKLKNLFSKKDKNRTPVPPAIVLQSDTAENISQASSYKLAPNISVDPQLVYKILSDINKEEKEYNAQLTKQELEIMASDRVIMSKIKTLIDNLRYNYLQTLTLEKTKAQTTATQSSKIIFGLTIVFFMIGLILLAVIINDININVRYKNQLEIAKERAEFLAQNKQQFLANMSHEIRTPLNAISGFSEQLRYSPLDEKQKEYLHAIQTASDHLLNLINDILDVSKIDAGKIVLSNEVFEVPKVIDEVVKMLTMQANEKGLYLDVEIPESEAIYVKGDGFRLKQVLLNILSNAIKFTEHGGVHIKYSALKKERWVDYTFIITDTGIGISDENQDKIFDEFSQADVGTTRKYGGTGLGLSISKKIIELQGGSITLESKLGKGSVFTISLTYPVASKTEDIKTLETELEIATPDKHLHVLVVDDEMINLKLAEIILQKHNIKANFFNNAKDALAATEYTQFDIAFIDLHMPGMDGISMLEKLHQDQKNNFPCIALTADVMTNVTEFGFNDILLKPYKEVEFLELLNKWSKSEHTNITSKYTEQYPPTESSNILFSLTGIEEFTGNDQSLVLEVIRSFIDEHKINLNALYQFSVTGDLAGLQNTAHKMLPSYAYLNIESLVPKLKFLEKVDNMQNDEIENVLLEILTTSKQIFEQLEEYYAQHRKVEV